MEIRSPKEMVEAITGDRKDKESKIFALKSKSTMNGAFFGGGTGLLIALHKKKNIYIYSLAGVFIGGFIANILTVKR